MDNFCFSDYLQPYLERNKDLFGGDEGTEERVEIGLQPRKANFLEVFLPKILTALQRG